MILQSPQGLGGRLALNAYRQQNLQFLASVLAVLSLDEVFQGCGEGRVRNAVFGNNGGDVAVRSHVEGDVGGADVWRRANAG